MKTQNGDRILGFHHFHLVPRLNLCVAVPLLLYAFVAWTGTTLAFICDIWSEVWWRIFLIRCVTSAGKEVPVPSAIREVFI
jgi:hypothetical protein